MRLLKSAKSSGSNQNGDHDSDFFQGGQADSANRDVMCLVYPDGRTTTVQPPSNPA